MPRQSRSVAQHPLSCWPGLLLSQVGSEISSGSPSLEASSPCSSSPPVFRLSSHLLHDLQNQCSSLPKEVTTDIFSHSIRPQSGLQFPQNVHCILLHMRNPFIPSTNLNVLSLYEVFQSVNQALI